MIAFLAMLDLVNRVSVPWGHAMVRASLDAAAGVAFVWLLFRLFRRTPPRLQCWVWRAVYCKVALSILGAGTVPLRILPGPAAVGADSPVQVGATLRSVPRVCRTSIARWTVGSALASPSAPLSALNSTSVVMLLWMIGVGIGAARVANAWRWAGRLRKEGKPVTDPVLLRAMRSLCPDTKRASPQLLQSPKVDTPLLIGIVRPAILVPADLVGRISPREALAVLAHELAHVRRQDLLWGWPAAVVDTVFFFHPAMWVAQRDLALAREVACDESAVRRSSAGAAEYLSVLLKIACGMQQLYRPPLASASIVESYKTLQRRFLAMRSTLSLSLRHRVVIGVIVGTVSSLGLMPWRLAARQVAAGDSPSRTTASNDNNPEPRRPVDPSQAPDVTSGWGASPSDVQYTAADRRTDPNDTAPAHAPTAEVQRLYRDLINLQSEVAQARQQLADLQQSNYQRQLDRHAPGRPTPYDSPRTVPSLNPNRRAAPSYQSDITYSGASPGRTDRNSTDVPSGPTLQYAVPDQRDQLDALEQDVHRILDQIHQMKAPHRNR